MIAAALAVGRLVGLGDLADVADLAVERADAHFLVTRPRCELLAGAVVLTTPEGDMAALGPILAVLS